MTYPNTIATDVIRRTGLSDIYSLTPGGAITVSVDKRSGLYQGAVVYTTDATLTKSSSWTAVSGDDTNDIADVAIPSAATGVAFVCSAITDTATPRVGAGFTVKDANTANSLTRHHRMRSNSGDGGIVPFSFVPPGNPFLWMDFTDPSTMFTDTGLTTLVSVDGDDINAIVSKGSDTQAFDTTTGSTNAPRYTTNIIGELSGAQFDFTNTEGLVATAEVNTGTSETASFLVIGRLNGATSNQGWVFLPPYSFHGSAQMRTSDLIVRAQQGKAAQQWFHGDTAENFALWARSETTQGEVSINTVAGTDSQVKGGDDSQGFPSIGVSGSGGAIFLDNTSILEIVYWQDEALPSAALMEAYATNRYGLSWA